MWLAWTRSLQQSDVDGTHPNLKAKAAFTDFDLYWQEELKLPEPSMFRALYRSAGRR